MNLAHSHHALLGVGLLLASACSSPPRPATGAADAGSARIVDAGSAPPKPSAPVVVDADTIVTASDQSAARKDITVNGPASIVWKSIGGDQRGPGTATVRMSASHIIALDSKRSSTHSVPIIDGVADFTALPKGKLVVRTTQGAQLFLGTDLVGTAPKPLTLPYGDYTVRVVAGGKAKTQRARVGEGTAELTVRMD